MQNNEIALAALATRVLGIPDLEHLSDALRLSNQPTEIFRAVHAAWDNKSIQFLRSHLSQNKLTDDLIEQSVIKGKEF